MKKFTISPLTKEDKDYAVAVTAIKNALPGTYDGVDSYWLLSYKEPDGNERELHFCQLNNSNFFAVYFNENLFSAYLFDLIKDLIGQDRP